MASIQTKKNNHYIVFYIDDPTPDNPKKKRTVWEPCGPNYKDAEKRLTEIQYLLDRGSTIPDSTCTVKELSDYFFLHHGYNKWQPSTLRRYKMLLQNYIWPYIGTKRLRDVKRFLIVVYYDNLRKAQAVSNGNRQQGDALVTEATVWEVHRLMRAMFNKAVQWEMVAENPFEKVEQPDYKPKPRRNWDDEQIRAVLEHSAVCEKENLCVHLTFACSMRPGEVGGLQWQQVDISDEAIAHDEAKITIDRQLQRVYLEDLPNLRSKQDVFYYFPAMKPNPRTALVLKTLKTDSSEREVWIPRTLALMLREWKAKQDQLKVDMGEAYQDHDLVVAHPDGRPVEGQYIGRFLHRVADELGLPHVVYHSMRVSSTTYKLIWTRGDIKSVQGDNGHARSEMVTDTYSRVIDKRRKRNAAIFEEAFYGQSNGGDDHSSAPDELEAVVAALRDNPELLKVIGSLVKSH